MHTSRGGCHFVALALVVGVAAGCGARAKLTVIEGTGSNPVLPPPNRS